MSQPCRIQVLLFGPQSRLAGQDALTLSFDHGEPTADEVLDSVALMYPELIPSKAGNRLAVNHQMADPTQRVSPDDEVALIGMLGGG